MGLTEQEIEMFQQIHGRKSVSAPKPGYEASRNREFLEAQSSVNSKTRVPLSIRLGFKDEKSFVNCLEEYFDDMDYTVEREYPTTDGRVDLIVTSQIGAETLVEAKMSKSDLSDAVEQLKRYSNALQRTRPNHSLMVVFPESMTDEELIEVKAQGVTTLPFNSLLKWLSS